MQQASPGAEYNRHVALNQVVEYTYSCLANSPANRSLAERLELYVVIYSIEGHTLRES